MSIENRKYKCGIELGINEKLREVEITENFICRGCEKHPNGGNVVAVSEMVVTQCYPEKKTVEK